MSFVCRLAAASNEAGPSVLQLAPTSKAPRVWTDSMGPIYNVPGVQRAFLGSLDNSFHPDRSAPSTMDEHAPDGCFTLAKIYFTFLGRVHRNRAFFS